MEQTKKRARLEDADYERFSSSMDLNGCVPLDLELDSKSNLSQLDAAQVEDLESAKAKLATLLEERKRMKSVLKQYYDADTSLLCSSEYEDSRDSFAPLSLTTKRVSQSSSSSFSSPFSRASPSSPPPSSTPYSTSFSPCHPLQSLQVSPISTKPLSFNNEYNKSVLIEDRFSKERASRRHRGQGERSTRKLSAEEEEEMLLSEGEREVEQGTVRVRVFVLVRDKERPGLVLVESREEQKENGEHKRYRFLGGKELRFGQELEQAALEQFEERVERCDDKPALIKVENQISREGHFVNMIFALKVRDAEKLNVPQDLEWVPLSALESSFPWLDQALQ